MENKIFRLFSFKRLAASLAAALVISAVVPILSFFGSCGEIRDSVVRLHILANSDSEADQVVKLIVRNAVLGAGEELLCGSADIDNTQHLFNDGKQRIIETANAVLKANGFDYTASAFYVTEYFGTREYENFTLPAGRYRAVKLVLGEGKGHNWWCVMFPPLCLPAAEAGDIEDCFGENSSIVTEPSKYIIRFKTVELFEKIKAELFDRR